MCLTTPGEGSYLKQNKSDKTRSYYLVYGYLVFFTNDHHCFFCVSPPTPFPYRRLFTWWYETAMWALGKSPPPPLFIVSDALEYIPLPWEVYDAALRGGGGGRLKQAGPNCWKPPPPPSKQGIKIREHRVVGKSSKHFWFWWNFN